MEFRRASRLPGAVSIPDAEVMLALDDQVSARLQQTLPAIAAVYLLIAAVRLFLQPGYGNSGLDWLTYVIGAAILVEWKLLRRGRIAPERVHLSALVLGGLILLRSLLTFTIASDISQVFFVLAFLLGGAVTLLAWRGFTYVASVAVLGWIAVAVQKLSAEALLCWSVVLLSSLAASIIVVRRRGAKHAQIERLRLEEAVKKGKRD